MIPGDTESEIITNIGDMTDEAFDDVEDVESEEEVVEEAQGNEDVQTPEEGTEAGGEVEKANLAPGQFGYDSKGNVIDHEGRVIAKSGAERRLFEKGQVLAYQGRIAQQTIAKLKQDNAKLVEDSRRISLLNNIPTQLGLNEQEAVMGMRLISDFKRDPVATLKYILTEARALGHNIDGVGAEGIDMKAIGRMIEDRLAPLVEDRATKQREAELEQKAIEQYNTFVSDPEFQFARVHEDVLARLLRQDPRLSPETAYYKLQSWAYQHGLDFTKPLRAQLAEVATRQSQPQVKTQVAPIVSGAGVSSGSVPTTEEPYAAPDTSYSDIIRQSMKQAGYNI